jgi:hypothetical protein
MSIDPGISTFLLRCPPGKAAKQIRRALGAEGLAVAGEIDLTARLSRHLRVGFPVCTVICVDYPTVLLEALAFDRSAAVLVPIHLVVTEHGAGTAVHMLNPSAALYDVLPVTARPAVSRLLGAVAKSLDNISARQHAFEAYA